MCVARREAGVHGGLQRPCRACETTGQRRRHLRRDEEEIGVASDLLAHLAQEMQKMEAKMGRFFRTR